MTNFIPIIILLKPILNRFDKKLKFRPNLIRKSYYIPHCDNLVIILLIHYNYQYANGEISLCAFFTMKVITQIQYSENNGLIRAYNKFLSKYFQFRLPLLTQFNFFFFFSPIIRNNFTFKYTTFGSLKCQNLLCCQISFGRYKLNRFTKIPSKEVLY